MNHCRENNEKIVKSVCFSDSPISIKIQFTYCGDLFFFLKHSFPVDHALLVHLLSSVHVCLNTDVSAYGTLVGDFFSHPGKNLKCFPNFKAGWGVFLLASVIPLPIFTGKLLAYSYAVQEFGTLEPNEITVGVFSRQVVIIQFVI